MNIKKIYMEFAEKYPIYAKSIVTYKFIEHEKCLEFKLDDGKTARYYPTKGFTDKDGTNYK